MFIQMLFGYSLNHIEENGYTWMLLYWKIKVYKRPRWNTEVIVKTWARKFEKVSSWRDFEIYDNNCKLIAIATTEWVLIDANKQSIARITDKMKEEYNLIPKSVFEEGLNRKITRS